MTSTLEQKAWFRILVSILESSETIEENNERLSKMRGNYK